MIEERNEKKLRSICDTMGIAWTARTLAKIAGGSPRWYLRKLHFQLGRLAVRIPSLSDRPYDVSGAAVEKVLLFLHENRRKLDVFEIMQGSGVGHSTVRTILAWLAKSGTVKVHQGNSREMHKYMIE